MRSQSSQVTQPDGWPPCANPHINVSHINVWDRGQSIGKTSTYMAGL